MATWPKQMKFRRRNSGLFRESERETRDNQHERASTFLVAIDLLLVSGASLASLLVRCYFLERPVAGKQLGMLLLFRCSSFCSAMLMTSMTANGLTATDFAHGGL